MIKVLEAVPNFSEGTDLEKVRGLVDVIAAADVEVLDWSADPDHNRSVVTYIGDPSAVAEASVAAAAFALEHIDLTKHRGVHPRVGALDVLPFVPLRGMSMADAVAVARRVGARVAEMGIPVYFYAQASDPPGRSLAELRRGGFEALQHGFPPDRLPDLPGIAADAPATRARAATQRAADARRAHLRTDPGRSAPSRGHARAPDTRAADASAADTRAADASAPDAGAADASAADARAADILTPHPTAGVTCVGARDVLLAWNLFVSGIDLEEARRIASHIRERDGGFAGVRALGLRLPRQDRVQISMNIEDVTRTLPLQVYETVEREVARAGGEITGAQVIGMIPDALVLPAAAGRLVLPDLGPARVLSHRVAAHVARRAGDRPETSDRTG